jgi:glycosyltransferase involved in cell wall biosynthesis/SAM-dependent methyltransferase
MALDRIVELPRRRQRRTAELVMLADRARDAGQWERAAELYKKALDRNPDSPPIWVQYGHALKESGELRDPAKLEQAELAYRMALSLDPGIADTYLQLGHILKLQGKTEEAEASYLRAFALDPSMPYPLEELGGLGWSGAHLFELEEMLGSDVSNSRRFSSEDWSVSENVNELHPQCPSSVEPPAALSIKETEVDVPTAEDSAATGDTLAREEPGSTSRNPVTILEPGNVFRLVYISGEPETPGHRYRVLRPMAAAKTLGAVVTWMQVGEIPTRLAEIERANAVVFWRTAWDQHVASAVETARYGGAKIIFDVDDLMVEPNLARVEVIDGIRTNNLTEALVRDHFERLRRTMTAADMCTATTEELAAHMRNALKPAIVQPNGFDHAILATSRLAARRHAAVRSDDGLLRIGYAGGSRTHQRDFAMCADAVAEILREHPECRLVAFRAADGSASIIDVEEFPALGGLEDKIEWRNLVPIDQLPNEVARFDINLAPLEVGNPFCEAKSELKFFEAALAGVVTIASPTGPYRRAIRHGETGFLPQTQREWHDALTKLVGDPVLRRRVSAAAHRDVLWNFGPECRTETMAVFLDLLRDGRDAARAFELNLLRQRVARPNLPRVPDHEVVFEVDHLGTAHVTVVVPLYNYAGFIGEALASVAAQTLRELDLVVIDDRSTDDSLSVAVDWAQNNVTRFNRISVLRNLANSGLGLTRNVGFDKAETPFVLPLDADNRLLPGCATACLDTAQATGAAFSYPIIKEFGGAEGLRGGSGYDPVRLANGNYIDAMALVSKAAWAAVGGYDHIPYGWEDFDFWCKLVDRGLRGEQVSGAPLAEYRVHPNSMLHSANTRAETVRTMIDHLQQRHPWLTIIWPLPDAPEAKAEPTPAMTNDTDRLIQLLPILRCPETGGRLSLAAGGDALVSEDGSRRWPLVHGRPLLFPGMTAPKVNPDTHLSNILPDSALALIRRTRGLVLHLSAGGTVERYDNVVECEAALFRHTDVIADVHRLPFADSAFEAVIALNAFEHYRDPRQAAHEIYRVLRPGGRVLIRTAFLQPLHEAPWHFYNCTRYGLETWFEGFETEILQVSDNFHAGYSLSWLASECEAALRARIAGAAADRFLSAPIERLVSLWRAPEETRNGELLWRDLSALPQDVQETVAAGFEYLGRRPILTG